MMRTLFVYILTSDETDFYYEQTLLSVCSLKYYNPDATIVVVADHLTAASLYASRSGLTKYVNQVICIRTPDYYSKMQCSRYLKTNLRKFIDGDYLFIDSDTIICGKMDTINTLEYEMAAVSDINGPLPLTDPVIISRCISAGFNNLLGQPYFNSGVMLVRDTPSTHLFYDKWFENWTLSLTNGVALDQPSLCQTNYQMGMPIKALSGVWNCQFKVGGYPFLQNALILHYYSNNNNSQLPPQYQLLFSKIKREGINDKRIVNLIKNPKSIFYSFLDMNEDMAFGFLSSDLLHLYYTSPSLFKISERFGKTVLRIKSLFSQ